MLEAPSWSTVTCPLEAPPVSEQHNVLPSTLVGVMFGQRTHDQRMLSVQGSIHRQGYLPGSCSSRAEDEGSGEDQESCARRP